MCQACELEGVDWVFRNGRKSILTRDVLYGVYEGDIKVVKLCNICSVELFHLGEIRFLSNHPLLALEIFRSAKRHKVEDFDLNYSFA